MLKKISYDLVTCTIKPGSHGVTDQWCESNCRGGIHPACDPKSGVHQHCICRDPSSIVFNKHQIILKFDYFYITIKIHQRIDCVVIVLS